MDAFNVMLMSSLASSSRADRRQCVDVVHLRLIGVARRRRTWGQRVMAWPWPCKHQWMIQALACLRRRRCYALMDGSLSSSKGAFPSCGLCNTPYKKLPLQHILIRNSSSCGDCRRRNIIWLLPMFIMMRWRQFRVLKAS
jgi:hypothetical protein